MSDEHIRSASDFGPSALARLEVLAEKVQAADRIIAGITAEAARLVKVAEIAGTPVPASMLRALHVKSPPVRHTPLERQRALAALREGVPIRTVAREFGVARSTVQDWAGTRRRNSA